VSFEYIRGTLKNLNWNIFIEEGNLPKIPFRIKTIEYYYFCENSRKACGIMNEFGVKH
jgi:hypothetical protein